MTRTRVMLRLAYRMLDHAPTSKLCRNLAEGWMERAVDEDRRRQFRRALGAE